MNPQNLLFEDSMNMLEIRTNDVILTNLCDGHQIGHILKIVGSEVGVASRINLR